MSQIVNFIVNLRKVVILASYGACFDESYRANPTLAVFEEINKRKELIDYIAKECTSNQDQ